MTRPTDSRPATVPFGAIPAGQPPTVKAWRTGTSGQTACWTRSRRECAEVNVAQQHFLRRLWAILLENSSGKDSAPDGTIEVEITNWRAGCGRSASPDLRDIIP